MAIHRSCLKPLSIRQAAKYWNRRRTPGVDLPGDCQHGWNTACYFGTIEGDAKHPVPLDNADISTRFKLSRLQQVNRPTPVDRISATQFPSCTSVLPGLGAESMKRGDPRRATGSSEGDEHRSTLRVGAGNGCLERRSEAPGETILLISWQ